MGALVRVQLEKCAVLDGLPKGFHKFDGHSVAGKIHGKRPLADMWKLIEHLRPQGHCEYTIYEQVGKKFIPKTAVKFIGSHQGDDLPSQFAAAPA